MAKYVKTSNLSAVKDEKVFVDANIWLYIFSKGRNPDNYLGKRYSSSFKYFLKNKTSIFIDLAVISEFANRYLRITHSNYMNKNGLKKIDCDYKKNYRKTDDFKEEWKNMCNIITNKILSKVNTVNFEYAKSSLVDLLNPDNLNADFNDNHIMNLCRTNNMYLLTHDGDFKNTDINIITENQCYWRR